MSDAVTTQDKAVTVVARAGSRVPAATIRAGMPVLARLAQEGRGTAEALLEESKAKESPFHGLFRWDEKDQALAREYRLQIGRHIWNSVEVRFRSSSGETATARAFTAVKVEGAVRYLPTPEVARSHGLREQVLKQAKEEIASMRRRHSVMLQLFERREIMDIFEQEFFGA